MPQYNARPKGTLLKPSEKNTDGHSKHPINVYHGTQKASRFEHLKHIVRSGLQTAFEVGAALLEIQRDKLYRDEFETFESFCESEFKIVRRRAYQLIEAAQVKAALPTEASTVVENERQARALAPVPEEQRVEVLAQVAAKGPVTAKAITEAVRERPHPSRWTNLPTDIQAKVKGGEISVGEANALYDAKQREQRPGSKITPAEPEKRKPEQHLDKTGYVIPDSILEDWQAAESFRSTLNDLQRIKLQIEKAIDKRDLIYREVGQDTVADLKNAWAALKQVLPYAVCPTCQGRTRSKCSVCKQRGFVSEFAYTHWFAKEVIELREKAIKK